MIIFLYGEDSYRSRKKLNELKERFLREIDPSGNSLTAVDGESATAEKINETISPSSLLSKKRMIVIENLFSNKSQTIFSQTADLLEKKENGENIITFLETVAGKKMPKNKSRLFEFLAKQKYSQEFKTLSNVEAAAWAKKEVEARGGKISFQAAAELVLLLGGDLWRISGEIDKLINYKAGQKLGLANGDKGTVIEAEDVKELVRGSFDEKIFSLTDALSIRNAKLASRLLEEQIEAGLSESYLLSMVIRQFKILLQIRQALDAGLASRKIISALKLHPFIVQKGINQARNFTLLSLKNILNHLVKIDYLMKRGKADIKTMLSLMLTKI